MKNPFLLLSAIILFFACGNTNSGSEEFIVTSDIDHFWEAYDSIQTTQDSTLQMTYLRELFLDRGTPGLEAIMEARRYTETEYLNAILEYPKFWNSIRDNTEKSREMAEALKNGITKLKTIYPDIKPAKIYFTIGVFRTPGTTLEDMVLIGSEMAMADMDVDVSEFPDQLQYVKDYFQTNPRKHLIFLNIHEYVHTQQKSALETNLLVTALNEGVAEFVAVKASGVPSVTEAISYGKKHDAAVKANFEKEMFSTYYQSWLWSSIPNDFDTRDLGYYVGYAIAEKYYDAQNDKNKAIQTLIDLDYQDIAVIESFVDEVGYFSQPISALKDIYESNRPEVVRILEFENGAKDVNPDTESLSIQFSQPMDTLFRNFRWGPKGEATALDIHSLIGYSDDYSTISLGINLESKKDYQVLVHDQFRNFDGVLLKAPFLIEFSTGE